MSAGIWSQFEASSMFNKTEDLRYNKSMSVDDNIYVCSTCVKNSCGEFAGCQISLNVIVLLMNWAILVVGNVYVKMYMWKFLH